MDTVHMIAVGPVDPALLDHLQSGVGAVLDITVLIERPLPVPEGAFHEMRRQYHSTTILRWLRTFYPQRLGFRRILGVIDVDLYVPQLNFVFGEADMATRTAVISLFRLRPQFYGQPPDEGVFHERCLKEAIHELGHTYGLGHCENSLCIMSFSNRIADTDRKGPGFCRACLRLLAKAKHTGQQG